MALLSTAQWQEQKDLFDLGIDLEPDNAEIYTTKAVVNFDSLMGTFSIPDRNDICGDDLKFSFALDEKGVVFIDDTGTAQRMIRHPRHPALAAAESGAVSVRLSRADCEGRSAGALGL